MDSSGVSGRERGMGVTVNGGNTGFSAGNAGGALGVTAGSAADRMRAARENRNKKPGKS